MKKLFTIFALLMTVVIGAKADAVTLFDAADDGWSGDLTTGSTKVENATWYGGGSAALANGKTVEGVKWGSRIKFGGGSTFQSGKDYARVLKISVPSAGTLKVYFVSGSNGDTRYAYVSSAPSSTKNDTGTAVFSGSDDGSGSVISGLVDAGDCYIWSDQNIGVMGVTFESSAPATDKPTIVTQPDDATYKIGTADYPTFTVEATPSAGTLSYTWYFMNGASQSSLSVNSATLDIASLPTLEFNAFKYIVLDKEGDHPIWCRLVDSNGAVNTRQATLTVKGKSHECQLIGVKFSNGVYGAITDPEETQNGTIEVPYMEGEEEPEPYSTSIEISEGATFYHGVGSIIVTAEDGTTQTTYDIVATPVTPLNVTEDMTDEFVDVPSWVYNHYGYDANKGLRFAKTVNDPDNMRISKGDTRQYYFISGAKTLKLTTAIGISAARAMNVYVNGVKLASPTTTGEAGTVNVIELDQTCPNLVMIESAQEKGDGGFSVYEVEAMTGPAITLQPKDVVYGTGSVLYPVLEVDAQALSGGELSYDWHVIINHAGVIQDVKLSGLSGVGEKSQKKVLDCAEFLGNMLIETLLTEPGEYEFYCEVAESGNGVSNSSIATVSVIPAYLVQDDNDEFVMSQANADASDFITEGEKGRWTSSTWGTYGNVDKFYNMSNPNQYLVFNAVGARDFKVRVYNGTPGRHYTVKINDEAPVVITHSGDGSAPIEDSQVFKTPTTKGVVTITVAGYDGGGNSVYPISLIFNNEATPETPDQITLNSKGYATFSCAQDVVASIAPGTIGDVTAYYASNVSENKLVLKPVPNNEIPAETGVLLYSSVPEAIVVFSAPPVALSPLQNNLLYPTTTANGLVDVPQSATTTGNDAMTLSGTTFKTFTGSKFNDNKAYLLKSEIVNLLNNNNASSLEIVFEDEATAVNGIAETKAEIAPVKVITAKGIQIGNYNIAGQQVK